MCQSSSQCRIRLSQSIVSENTGRGCGDMVEAMIAGGIASRAFVSWSSWSRTGNIAPIFQTF
uniref:ABA receptor n=1 Tax=Rhizophora mucronata TaxID=61149 RepID=A0A2P2IL17_RHIMU